LWVSFPRLELRLARDDQIFCDSIGTITVTGAVVRIDFVSLSPSARETDPAPKLEFTHRVIMPLEGFLRSVGKLQETVEALVRRGVVTKQPSSSTDNLATPGERSGGAPGAIPATAAEPPRAAKLQSSPPKPTSGTFP
jgi:hypothetical protein